MKQFGMTGFLARIAFISLVGTCPALAQDVLIVGDSMMKGISHAIEKRFKELYNIEPESFAYIGTGLARSDLFDWNAKVDSLVKAQGTDIVVFMMGGNDDQPMKVGSKILRTGTPEWHAEYTRRFNELLDTMLKGGVRTVFVVGNPAMRDEKLDELINVINGIQRKAASERDGVIFFGSAELLSKGDGKYSAYVIQKDGMPLRVRSSDGLHLNVAGADLLAAVVVPAVMDEYGKSNQ